MEKEQTKRTCKLYLKRKHRMCKFDCLEGEDFCHFHILEKDKLLEEQENNTQKDEDCGRVVCPLDESHTVDVNKLSRHLKICPSLKYRQSKESSIYFVKGINSKHVSLNETEQEREEGIGKKLLQGLYMRRDQQLVDLVDRIQNKFTLAVQMYKTAAQIEDQSVQQLTDYLLDRCESTNCVEDKVVKKVKTEDKQEENTPLSDTQKDHRQVCKLVQVLQEQGLANLSNVYIEFGAGKGLLSHGIAKQLASSTPITPEFLMESMNDESFHSKRKMHQAHVLEQEKQEKLLQQQKEQELLTNEKTIGENEKIDNSIGEKQKTDNCIGENLKTDNNFFSCHILLELEGRRKKVDRLHRDNPFFLRYRMNILDFDVNSLQAILTEKGYPDAKEQLNIIGVSKHMCGGATDLSINTLINCKAPQKFQGMLIATCCHHRCTAETYTNLHFLTQELGFTPQDLQILFYCSSWYVSKIPKLKCRLQEDNNAIIKENSVIPDRTVEVNKHNEEEWLTSENKSLIGKMVKRIIDIGRILNLIGLGKQGRVVKYCDFGLSPENFVIIAK